MLSDGRPSRRQNRRSRPQAAGSGPDPGAAGLPGHALLSPIGHTVWDTGHTSWRHGSFAPLALAGKSARASIGSLATGQSGRPWEATLNAKSIAGWLAIALVIWWVIESPTSAAHV